LEIEVEGSETEDELDELILREVNLWANEYIDIGYEILEK
jgi:hypothetical protein